jgi:hypothetical protein
MSNPLEALAKYPLIDALVKRRSRRFALGMTMPAGPLAYTSQSSGRPLSEQEEALLVFAACGLTGYALADLVYASGQGDIMTHLAARTIASGDGAQAVALFVINDEGTCLVKRAQDLSQDETRDVIDLVQRGEYTEFYRRVRIKIKDGRSAPPIDPMYNLRCNAWSVYQPGTTYFVPVNDISFILINGLLNILSPTTGAYVLDERAEFRSAGLEAFAQSRGGHLDDDLESHEILTIQRMEMATAELVAVEQGMVHQNLGLMAHALGLGGFPNFAVHEFGWFEALGFEMGQMRTAQYFGKSALFDLVSHVLKRDPVIPFPLRLDARGQTVLKAHCPPNYPTMREAVMDVVNAKFGPEGIFRGRVTGSAWRQPSAVADALPGLSTEAIEATVAYCEYVYQHYKRFPGFVAPFRTVLGFQAAHLDVEFFDKFYRPEALSDTHRHHMATWHAAGAEAGLDQLELPGKPKALSDSM